MAGARQRVVSASQQQYQQMSLQVIEQLDEALDKMRARILDDLRLLKSGEVDLEQVKISDQDYEIMPKQPEIQRNGAPVKQKVPA